MNRILRHVNHDKIQEHLKILRMYFVERIHENPQEWEHFKELSNWVVMLQTSHDELLKIMEIK